MTAYTNWISNSTNTAWKHRHNNKVVVAILPNETNPHMGKYLIYHSHPGPNNTAIMQLPEGAMSMESARKKAEKHLRHWQKETLWRSDADWNKLGKTGA